MRYKIIRNADADLLSAQVSALMDEGWVPHGPLVIEPMTSTHSSGDHRLYHESIYMQAMTKGYL